MKFLLPRFGNGGLGGFTDERRMPVMKLKDKIAIVTGSSRGIGKAIAKAYAREGATVIVAARTEQAGGRLPGTINQTVEEIAAFGGRAIPIRTDIGDEASIEAMVKQTLEIFGRIDVLFNNAGILFSSLIGDTTLKRWELVMKVNVTGTFLCSRAVLPTMTAQRSGSIINMSSVAAASTWGAFTMPSPRRRSSASPSAWPRRSGAPISPSTSSRRDLSRRKPPSCSW
jgi:NAD(P)-dependent dehydrogenase (short-subunit alcohol dehydrogenase family)